MAGFDIVAAGRADMADVAELLRAYADALPIDLSAQGFVEELADLPGAYAPPRGALLLTRGGDGAALGCVALRPIDEGAAEVKRLFVTPAARGTGAGRALVAAIVEEGRRRAAMAS